jgi:Flp pilus assembly protein TadD
MPKSRHRRSTIPKALKKTLSAGQKASPGLSAPGVLAILKEGHADRALALAEQILIARPHDVDLLHIAGVAATRCRRFDAAQRHLLRASELRPGDSAIWVNRGLAQSEAGEAIRAAQSYKRACSIDPSDANAFYNLGNALNRLEDHRGAVQAYRRALDLGGQGRADLWNNLGGALASISRHEEAVSAYRSALGLDPDATEVMKNLSLSLIKTNRSDEALEWIERARQRDQHHPDWHPRLVALRMQGRVAEALAELDSMPSSERGSDFHHLRGVLLSDLGHYAQSMLSYLKALSEDRDDPETRFSRSLLLLLQGEFATGWLEYEWRWQSEEMRASARHFSAPAWRGEADLKGKTVLLYAEQGSGDTLQFVRYVATVVAAGARVILEVQAPLLNLIKNSFGENVHVVPAQSVLPPFDFHCPLMSLPYACRRLVGPAPLNVGPYLHIDSAKRDAWARALGTRRLPRVGLVWRGNAKHLNDHNRSISLDLLLAALPEGIDYFTLQKGLTDEERALLSRRSDVRCLDDELTDYGETGAAMQQLDLIISVDTSVAHLAGALDAPCWIMLPFSPDFRWLLGRSDSPWYPSVRLFRQKERRNWSSVLADISAELNKSISSISHEVAA